MTRFVLLRHETPPGYPRRPHWDLMLESDGQLEAWALEQLPSGPGQTVDADPLPPHRLAYLDYEGEISGGRGSVHRWDRGECETLARDDGGWRFRLRGQRLAGEFALKPDPSAQRWDLLWLGR